MSDDRRYPARPLVAASCAVVRDRRVLVAARARPPLRSVFSLPGGLVEVGETLASAALRELVEETSVLAEMIGPLPPIEYIDRDTDGSIRHHFVICPHAVRWVSGEPEIGPEASAFLWLAPDEIGSVETTPGLDPVLRAALVAAGVAGA